VFVCMYVCMYVRMYVCTYVCMYVRMYVCMYVRMYVFCSHVITFVNDKGFGLVDIGQERNRTVGHEGGTLERRHPQNSCLFRGISIARGGDCEAPKYFGFYRDRYRHGG
jgi:hypothetical protein